MRTSFIAAALVGICSLVSAAETSKPLTLQSTDQKSAITLQLAENWKTYINKDKSVSIEIPKSGFHVEVSSLSQSSVEDAAKSTSALIKPWVTGFKLTETQPITVAGSAGSKVIGTGEEADDGDPSNAEVYLFSVDGKVYMICVHGEGDVATKSKTILPTLLESIKKANS